MPDKNDLTQARIPVAARIGLWLGPLCGLAMLFLFDPDPAKPEIGRCAAVAVLMAIWWVTEALPLAVTSLLPVALFPMLGLMKGSAVAGEYFSWIIFLYMGGFIMALAMERWNLHRRIALRILLVFGVRPGFILMGFMVSTAFLSMWISNTACTMMMIPILLALLAKFEETAGAEKVHRFAVGLLLAVAYSATIGGVATLVGTPPNAILPRVLSTAFPDAPEIGFANWFFFALPVSIVFLALLWVYLAILHVPRGGGLELDISIVKEEYARLGRMKYEEKVVASAFAVLVVLWMTRSPIDLRTFRIPGWSELPFLPAGSFIDDGTVAILVALALFMIPSRQRAGRIMDWAGAVGIPWHIILLFGGGFALAAGFEESGLSVWLGGRLEGLGSYHPILIVVGVCLFTTFLTELTSNTATTNMLLPILASLSVALRVHPLLLMIPATLSCSFAFMLPVATPPNAIIFGSDRIRISEMARAGVLLNLLGVVLVTLLIYTLGGPIFGIDMDVFPDWAAQKGAAHE